MARSVAIRMGIAALLAAGVWGQTMGTISGTVHDPAGLVVSQARVRILDSATGALREAITDPTGVFTAPGLPPGKYQLEITQAGFQTLVLTDIEVAAGRAVRADMQLRLGETRESVTVTGEPPLVSMAAGDWGGSIRQQQLNALPLKDRNTFDLVALQPGATIPTNTDPSPTAGLGTVFSVNGSRPWQNSFRLDGVTIADVSGAAPASASGRLLGVEALEEVHLITSPFSAEFGRTSGGIFTAVSRSGSNELHGSAYGFLRNEAMDAKNYFDVGDQRIPPLRRSQFGGMLSGPVIQNRLFLLGNYEGFRQYAGSTLSRATLSAAARQGIITPGGTPVNVASSVRPFLDLFPLPNGRDFGNGSAEFISRVNMDSKEDFWTLKGDWLANSQVRTSVRYTRDTGNVDSPDYYDTYLFHTTSRYSILHSETTWVVGASNVFNFRGSISRVRNGGEYSIINPLANSLSFVPGKNVGVFRIVGLDDTGDSPLGTIQSLPRNNSLRDYQLQHDASLIRGAHVIRYGVAYDQIRLNQRSDLYAAGSYRFNSISEFLRGSTRSADLMAPGSDSTRRYKQHLFSLFVQDEWRARPGLQVMLGMRYEPYSTPVELDGKVAKLLNPATDTAPIVGGAIFDNPSRGNFAPRAALAWDVTGKGHTVIRAGAGIFYDLLGMRDLQNATRMPPFFQRLSLQRPAFPDLTQSLGSAAASLAPDLLDYYLKQPYVTQFQLRIEQQLGRDMVFHAGYVGSKGTHLMGFIGNINTPVPQVVNGQLFFSDTAPRINPGFQGIGIRRTQFDSSYHALNLFLSRRLRGGLQFQAKYSWSKSIDNNSTMLRAEYLSDGGMPSPFDYRANRGLSNFDRRHDFAASFVWQMPALGDSMADRVLGRWEIDGTFLAASGHPFNAIVGFDQARLRPGSGDQGQRPNLTPGFTGDLVKGDVNQWFNPQAFTLPAAGFLGNLGRNTITGPGLMSLDVAVQKPLWRTDRQRITLRAEAYNVTNRPNFAAPAIADLGLFDSTGARLPTAGRLTSTTTTSRQMQLSLRWAF